MTPIKIRVLPPAVVETTRPSGEFLAGAFQARPLWTEDEDAPEEGDYPGLHFDKAAALLDAEDGEQAAAEIIKEMYVVGPDEQLLSELFNILLMQLHLTLNRMAYRRKRHILGCALACCGRMLNIERNDRRLQTFAKLYSRYELSGPIVPEQIETITGMNWNAARNIYRTYGGQV